jgi:general stress protein 26
MSDSKPSERIWALMQEIGVAMVVTHSGDGGMRARPMLARPENDDDAVYFLTDADAPKDREIANNSQVCLVFSDPQRKCYVSVMGTAEICADAEIAARIWTEGDGAFWKNAQDPRIRVIRVTPEHGEYWEEPGFLANVVSIMRSGAKNETRVAGDNEKVTM